MFCTYGVFCYVMGGGVGYLQLYTVSVYSFCIFMFCFSMIVCNKIFLYKKITNTFCYGINKQDIKYNLQDKLKLLIITNNQN